MSSINGINTLAVKVETKIIDLSFSADSIRVVLADGREIKSGGGYRIKIPRQKSPQYHVDAYPREEREDAGKTSAY